MADVTVQWLLDKWRIDIDDPEQENEDDQLWTDSEGITYIDLAQKEFCHFVDCIPDASRFSSINIEADSPTFYFDPVITKIRRARLVSTGRILNIRTVAEINEKYLITDYGIRCVGDWESLTGIPTDIVTDYEIDVCRLVPIPTEADSIALLVYRLPADIESTSDDLEIPNRFRDGLLFKMKALAYAKQDADTYDPKSAQLFEIAWQKWLFDCARQSKVRTRPAGVVAYGGY